MLGLATVDDKRLSVMTIGTGMAERILNYGAYKRAPEALTCTCLEIFVKL